MKPMTPTTAEKFNKMQELMRLRLLVEQKRKEQENLQNKPKDVAPTFSQLVSAANSNQASP